MEDKREMWLYEVKPNSDESTDEGDPESSDTSEENSQEKNADPRADDVCNLRSSRFKDIVGKLGFVDKTLMIKDFLMDVTNILCACGPNRFGKTTNMDMVKTFLSITVDKKGRAILNPKNTENYKLFQTHNLKIYKEERYLFHSSCGQYPVIHTDFGKIGGNCKAKIMESMKKIVQQIFSDHAYVVKETNSDEWTWRSKGLRESKFKTSTFVAYTLGAPVEKLNEEWIFCAWEFLVDVLHLHFNKPVILLIDNFDSPSLNSVSIHGLKFGDTMRWVDKFTRNMILILIERNTVDRALLNKIIPVTEEGLLDPEDMMCPLMNEPLGFTESEVSLLLENPAFKMININDMRRWYGGYRVFCRFKQEVSYVYNPWSVLNFLQKSVRCGEPCYDLYWAETCPVLDLEKLFQNHCIRETVWDILNKGHIKTGLLYCSLNVKMQHIAEMVKFHRSKDDSELTSSHVLLLLCLWGYLYETEEHGNRLVSNFFVPNMEVKKALTLKFMPSLFKIIRANFPLKQHQLWKYC